MTRTVTIPIDLKAEALSANGRVHWAVRKARTKALREKSKLLTRAAGIPPMSRAHLTVTIAWPDRRRRDAANLSPTIKACIDGAIDARVLSDDSDMYLVGPDLRVAPGTSRSSDRPGVAWLTFAWDELTTDGAR